MEPDPVLVDEDERRLPKKPDREPLVVEPRSTVVDDGVLGSCEPARRKKPPFRGGEVGVGSVLWLLRDNGIVMF
jgi:hypothetical protein